MRKFKVTYPSGAEDIIHHYGDKTSLIAMHWGSIPIPEGCMIEQIDPPEHKVSKSKGKQTDDLKGEE